MLTRELLVTVAAACSSVVKKIKSVVYLHNKYFTTGCPTQLHLLLCFSCSSTSVTSALFSFADLLKLLDLSNPLHLVGLFSLFNIFISWGCQSAGIFSSFEVHQFSRSTVYVYVLLHYIPFSVFLLPSRTSSSAWQKRLPTTDAYHWHQCFASQRQKWHGHR